MNAPRLGLLCVCEKLIGIWLLGNYLNYWQRGKDFGMSLQIRYFALK